MSFGVKLFFYEFLIGAAGVSLALFFNFWPQIQWWNDRSLQNTFLFSMPLVIFAWVVTSSSLSRWSFLKKISSLFEESVMGAYIRDANWISFFILSIGAGVVEEILFRGILQNYVGLIITSLIFGALHAMTLAYFFIATLIGFYLGWVYLTTDALLVPILIHAVYDFAALLLYRRVLRLSHVATSFNPKYE